MSKPEGQVDLAVVGLGMISAVGFQPAECMAAIRAGLPQFVEIAFASHFLRADDKEPDKDAPIHAVGGCVPGLEEDVPRAERCRLLGEQALRQVLAQAGALPEKTALLVALPPLADGDPVTRIVEALPRPPALVEKYPQGHAAALLALAHGARLLQEKKADLVLLGGVDSWIDRDLLYSLNAGRRLKHSKSMEGFVPGEAAAFLAITTSEQAQARGQSVLVRITGVALAEEKVGPTSEEACRGLGLSQAIRVAAGGPFNTDRIDLIVCDLNGEPYRHEEWAAALAKCVQVSPKEFRLWHPADCIGDVGAASAAAHLVAAAAGLKAGVTRRREALVWGSSEAGLRGAVVLARTE